MPPISTMRNPFNGPVKQLSPLPSILKVWSLPGQPAGRKDLPNISK
jgi:hypothetical protein